MKAKKIIQTASLILLIAIANPASSAVLVSDSTNSATTTESARAQELMVRLENIKEMDKTEMTRLEKKELRNEVKEMKKEMKAISGGVYLSIGALIIIILLLILLL